MADAPPDLPPPTADGTFAKTPLVQVLVYVLERGLTGTIEIVHPEGPWASFLVIEGLPAKGRTSEPVAYLGHVLRELGYIDDATLNASLATMASERKLHGQILLEMGKITADQLFDGLRSQLARKLEHLFDWPPETRFAYYDGFDALHTYGADDVVQIDSLPLVWSSIRTQPPWEHVHAALTRIGNAAMRIALGAQIERFELNKEERAAAEILKVQPMRVHELAGTKLLGAAATQLLAYCLLITKQVELVAAPDARVARVQLSQVVQRAVAEEQMAVHGFDPRASSPFPGTPTPSVAVTIEAEVGKMRQAAAPAPAPKALDPALQKRKDEIVARASAIKGEEFFQMLGVKQEATVEEVNAAFMQLAKTWHPDRVPAAIADVRGACSTVFSHLSEAQQTLVDPARRTQYMKLLKEGGATPDEQAHVQAVLEAATNFQKAEFFLRRGDMKEAEALCRKAFEADATPPEYGAMMAWLESLKPENQGPEATQRKIEMLDHAIAKNDRLERAYFYRGLLYKRLNNVHRAASDFRRAAELNPRNIDAVREVRLFEMRKSRGSIPPPAPEEKDKGTTTGARRALNAQGRPSSPPSKKEKESDPSLGGLFGKLFKK
jgi:curved DNA-binding protein CbpA